MPEVSHVNLSSLTTAGVWELGLTLKIPAADTVNATRVTVFIFHLMGRVGWGGTELDLVLIHSRYAPIIGHLYYLLCLPNIKY